MVTLKNMERSTKHETNIYFIEKSNIGFMKETTKNILSNIVPAFYSVVLLRKSIIVTINLYGLYFESFCVLVIDRKI